MKLTNNMNLKRNNYFSDDLSFFFPPYTNVKAVSFYP